MPAFFITFADYFLKIGHSKAMSAITIKKFSKPFMIGDAEVQFEFFPMNVRIRELYQVYAIHGDKKLRFHMQINDEGTFRIMDKARIPPTFLALESEFSAAIIAS